MWSSGYFHINVFKHISLTMPHADRIKIFKLFPQRHYFLLLINLEQKIVVARSNISPSKKLTSLRLVKLETFFNGPLPASFPFIFVFSL